MRGRGNIHYLLAGLVGFLFASGFLGFCVGPDYKPCSIEFKSPVNGTVFEPGTSSVLIKGLVKKGDSEATKLEVNGAAIAFDKATGAFQYRLLLDNANIYTTATFTVTDKKYITYKERVSYAIGYSAEPGSAGVVDNAIRFMLTENLLNQTVSAATSFMNTWKNDLIYGWDSPTYGSHNPESLFAGMAPLLPIKMDVPDGMNGYIEINHLMSGNDKGYINIGKIGINADIKPDRNILASLSVSPEGWVDPNGGSSKALFVQGHYRTYPLGIETRIHFTVTAKGINASNAKLKLSANENNKIVASVDLSSASMSLVDPKIEFGFLSVPGWLTDIIIDLLKSEILSKLVVDTELVDMNSLTGEISGMTISGWPMIPANLYTATESDITMDLGLGAVIDPAYPVLIPGLTKFFSTPGDSLPALQISGDENVMMAINDDLINLIAFNATQLGLIKDMDISDAMKDMLKDLMPRDNIKAKLSLTTPPIIDLSGNNSGTLATYDVGRVVVRNVIMELENASLIAPKYPCVLKVSGDLDAVFKLNVGPDGKSIQGTIDLDNSKPAQLVFLYTNSTTSALLPSMKDQIGAELTKQLKGLLENMLKFSIPAIPVYGQNVDIMLNGTEFPITA